MAKCNINIIKKIIKGKNRQKTQKSVNKNKQNTKTSAVDTCFFYYTAQKIYFINFRARTNLLKISIFFEYDKK